MSSQVPAPSTVMAASSTSGVLDGWFITCQYFSVGKISRREPRGDLHLRQVGARTTACGEAAMEWPMYFDHPIDVRDTNLCLRCARARRLRP
jgi:hypothetical protein